MTSERNVGMSEQPLHLIVDPEHQRLLEEIALRQIELKLLQLANRNYLRGGKLPSLRSYPCQPVVPDRGRS